MTSNIGPYEIRGRLGAGAMAVVWRAWDPKLEREVAIKEPLASTGISPDMVAELAGRFVQEGKTAARLSHPGIVTIYAADVFDGRPAIVMELLRGHSLASLIDSGELPLDASLSVLEQLLDALDYAHTMGVVHRDVKPDNVIVTDDGRVKLTDFGVAHVSRLDTGAEALIVGTPGYMAPEQIRAEPVDARADVFGIGALAYELLTQRNPFGATEGQDTATIKFRTTAGPDVVFYASDSVSPAIQAVILRALQRDARQRYSSASEMRWDLHAAGTGISAGNGETLAGLVGELPDENNSAVSFTASTLGVATDRLTKKGSSGWTIGVAAGIVALVLVFLALTSGSGTIGFAILALAGSLVGGTYWLHTARANSGEHELPPEAIAMSKGLSSVGDQVSIELRGPRENRVVRVSLPCIVGRSAEADLDVGDELVSRSHLLIQQRGEEVWVADMGSRNGTFLDGFPVHESQRVGGGSIVTIGSTEVIIDVGSE